MGKVLSLEILELGLLKKLNLNLMQETLKQVKLCIFQKKIKPILKCQSS